MTRRLAALDGSEGEGPDVGGPRAADRGGPGVALRLLSRFFNLHDGRRTASAGKVQGVLRDASSWRASEDSPGTGTSTTSMVPKRRRYGDGAAPGRGVAPATTGPPVELGSLPVLGQAVSRRPRGASVTRRATGPLCLQPGSQDSHRCRLVDHRPLLAAAENTPAAICAPGMAADGGEALVICGRTGTPAPIPPLPARA